MSVFLVIPILHTFRQGTCMGRGECQILAVKGSEGRKRSGVITDQYWLCTQPAPTVHKVHELANMPHPDATNIKTTDSLLNVLIPHWLHYHRWRITEPGLGFN